MELKEWLKGDKKLKWIIIAGFAVIALIAVSGFLPKESSAPTEETAAAEASSLTNEEYERRYQTLVKELVQEIAGVGRAEVAVTLQTGVEYVYVKEESKSADRQDADSNRITERNTLEQKPMLVEDDNGNRKALLRTTLEPTVRGVVVVCEGGGDPLVIEQVTMVVKTALGIGANQVCVARLT